MQEVLTYKNVLYTIGDFYEEKMQRSCVRLDVFVDEISVLNQIWQYALLLGFRFLKHLAVRFNTFASSSLSSGQL